MSCIVCLDSVMIMLGHHCVAILFGENANLGAVLKVDVYFFFLY